MSKRSEDVFTEGLLAYGFDALACWRDQAVGTDGERKSR